MNITIDNYEAYLLDYIEGKLSPEGATQLQAFIETQGLNWSELTEDLPHLEAPQIAFEHKERLKKKPVVVPLYVKIASAAATAGLLLTVGLWPEKQLPTVEPIAELTPIEAQLTITEKPICIVPRRAVQFTEYQHIEKTTTKPIEKTIERPKVEAIAELQPLKPQEALAFEVWDFDITPEINWLRYKLETEQAYAHLAYEQFIEEELPTSLIGLGIYRMTEGRHSSILDLINAGLHIAKKEVVKVSTDIALTAYERADETFEDVKERWREKHEE